MASLLLSHRNVRGAWSPPSSFFLIARARSARGIIRLRSCRAIHVRSVCPQELGPRLHAHPLHSVCYYSAGVRRPGVSWHHRGPRYGWEGQSCSSSVAGIVPASLFSGSTTAPRPPVCDVVRITPRFSASRLSLHDRPRALVITFAMRLSTHLWNRLRVTYKDFSLRGSLNSLGAHCFLFTGVCSVWGAVVSLTSFRNTWPTAASSRASIFLLG